MNNNYGPENRVIEAQRNTIRAQALTVPCDICHQPTGQPCRNLTTGQPLDHTSHQPAHLRRLQHSGAV